MSATKFRHAESLANSSVPACSRKMTVAEKTYKFAKNMSKTRPKIGKKTSPKKVGIFEREKGSKKTVQGALPKAMPILGVPSLGGLGPLGGWGVRPNNHMLIIEAACGRTTLQATGAVTLCLVFTIRFFFHRTFV